MPRTVQFYLKPNTTVIKKVSDPEQYYFNADGDRSMYSETTYYRFNEESLDPNRKGDTWVQVGEEEMAGAKPISRSELMEYLCHEDWLAWSNQNRIPKP